MKCSFYVSGTLLVMLSRVVVSVCPSLIIASHYNFSGPFLFCDLVLRDQLFSAFGFVECNMRSPCCLGFHVVPFIGVTRCVSLG